MEAVRDHERAIADYALERLTDVPGLKVFGPVQASLAEWDLRQQIGLALDSYPAELP